MYSIIATVKHVFTSLYTTASFVARRWRHQRLSSAFVLRHLLNADGVVARERVTLAADDAVARKRGIALAFGDLQGSMTFPLPLLHFLLLSPHSSRHRRRSPTTIFCG